MNTRRISFLALSALPLIACSQPTSTEGEISQKDQPLLADPTPVFDPDLVAPPTPDELVVSTVQVGDGWRKIRVVGKAIDSATDAVVAVDRELVVIQDKTKVDSAPIASFVKTEIRAEADATKTTTLGLSKTSFLAAETLPEGDDVDIIDPIAAEQIDNAMKSGTTAMAFGCSNEDKTYSKTISTTKTYSHTKNTESGSFNGSMAFTATLAASGTGKVTIRVFKSPYSFCAPYKVKFKNANFAGKADVTAKANVNAAFEKEWKYDKKVAQPSLGTLAFAVGPIPVKINFSAPIHVGVEADAKATLKLDGSATGRATLNVTCTTGGCSGSKTATFGWTAGTTPTVAAEAKINVTPYAYAGVHANLYTDWVANAEIGVKAKVKGELWGYAGNTCGDGDFNGSNELVSALALDARVGIDLVAKAGLVGSSFGPWSWTLLDKHVAFYDLGPATASAMAPMLQTKANPIGSTTVAANGRMRPCWPWTDKMKYRINYNDGSPPTEFWESPVTLFTQTHPYPSFGPKVVSVTAVVDTQGRTPGKTTNDNIYLKPFVFEPILVATKLSL